ETADTHTIEIIATSSDGSTSSDTFAINVTDVDENPIAVDDNVADHQLSPNLGAAGGVVKLQAFDALDGYSNSATNTAVGTDGSFVTVWRTDNQDDVASIYVQGFNADGSLNTEANPDTQGMIKLQVTDNPAGQNFHPEVSAIGTSGAFAVTWMGEEPGSNEFSIYLQLFNADGSINDTVNGRHKLEAFDNDTGRDRLPTVTAVGDDGDFVVVWQGEDEQGDRSVSYAKFNATGEMDASGIQKLEVDGNLTMDDYPTSVTALGNDGAFAIGYRGSDIEGDASSYIQVFDQNVNKTSLNKLETPNQTQYEESSVKISAIGDDGSYVAVFASAIDSSANTTYFAQRFNADGTPHSSGLQEVDSPNADLSIADAKVIALGTSGAYVLGWSVGLSDVNTPTQSFIQVVGADGDLSASQPFELEAPFMQGGNEWPTITPLEDGGFVVTWIGQVVLDNFDDFLDSTYGQTFVYTQKFNADGTVDTSPSPETNGIVLVDSYDSDRVLSLIPTTTANGENGEYVVSWPSVDKDGNVAIYNQRFDENGHKITQETPDNSVVLDVLSNDFDPDEGDVVSIWKIADQDASAGESIDIFKGGELVGSAQVQGGNIVFTPDANMSRLAEGEKLEISFEYTIRDNANNSGDESTASVTFNIVGADDASVVIDDIASVNENETLTGNVLTNDSDVDDTLSVAMFILPGDKTEYANGETGIIENVGSFTLNGDGSYTFIPVEHYDGAVPQIHYYTNTGVRGALNINVVNAMEVGEISDIDLRGDANNHKLSENAVVDTEIGIKAFAEDPDGQVTYSLIDDQAGLFAIDENSGVVTLKGNVDYEQSTSHTIIVQATSNDGSTSTKSFTIDIGDNADGNGGEGTKGDTDNAVGPVRDSDDVIASLVSENAPIGTYVGMTAFAEDADGDKVTYSLINVDVDEKGETKFAIDSETGEITVAGNVNFEKENFEKITLVAHSEDGSTSTQELTIVIHNDATGIGGEGTSGDTDNAIGPITDTDDTIGKVSENADEGTKVGIQAFAKDGDKNDKVTYSLIGDTGPFEINQDTGVITVKDNLNFEIKSEYQVTVLATSEDTSTSTKTFTIEIGDNNDGIGGEGTNGDTDNDVGPVRDSDDVIASLVSENAPIGTYVGMTAFAEDADGDKVTYSLINVGIDEKDNAKFEIDSETGEITVAGNLDFEKENFEKITLVAHSEDGSTSTQELTIVIHNNATGIGGEGTIGDTDNAVGPVTDINASVNEVGEFARSGATVGITSFANDADNGDSVTYSLSEADQRAGLFAIDDDGIITVIGNLDYETAQSHQVTVIVTSYDTSKSSKTFTITVTDEAEEIVIEQADGGQAIEETAQVGDVVGQVTAVSNDNKEVSYKILSGNDGNFVTIDNNGEVTLTAEGIAALNDDVGNITSLAIEVEAASGSGNDRVANTTTVNITLDEIVKPTIELASASDSGITDDDITNVKKPVITGSGEIGSTVVLTLGGTEIGRGVVEGDGTYAIESTVSLAQGSHTITVNTTDTAGNSDDAEITITVDTQGEGAITIDPVTGDNLIDSSERDTTIELTGSVSGEFKAGDVVTTTINGQEYQGEVETGGTTWRISNVNANDIIADDTFTVKGVGQDIAGNKVTASKKITIDIFANTAPIAVDDELLSISEGTQLYLETFESGTTGWSNQKLSGGALKVDKGVTSFKTFDFGVENAGKTVSISFLAKGTKHWDGGNDNFVVRFNNEIALNKSLSDQNWRAYNNLEATVRPNGKVTISFHTSTNKGNERLFINNLIIEAGPDYAESISTLEDRSLLIDVLANDTDPEGDAIAITHLNGTELTTDVTQVAVVNAQGVTVGHVSVSNGQVEFVPNDELDKLKVGEEETLTFTYAISDGALSSSPATVTLKVVGTNDAPQITQLLAEVEADTTDIVIGHVTDIDGSIDLAKTTQNAQNGTVSIDVNGNIIYTPNSGFTGSETVNIVAVDNNGGKTTQSISVDVVQTNTAPTAIDDDLRADTGTIGAGSEQNVSGNTSNNLEEFSDVVALANGNYFVVWGERISDQRHIKMQQYQADGQKVGGPQDVANYGDSQPSIAKTSSGGFVIAWEGDTGAIYYRRYDENGVAIDQHDRNIDFDLGDDRSDVQVVGLADGGFGIVFNDLSDEFTNVAVQFVRVDANGNDYPPTLLSNDDSVHQIHPTAIQLSNGDIMTSWVSWEESGWKTYTQRLDSNGNKIGDMVDAGLEIQSPAPEQHIYNFPELTALSDGGYLLTWV
ncbi:MAG: cadherin domain-containing protein, partial [Psychrobium sp.]